jgi:hypothetical protein
MKRLVPFLSLVAVSACELPFDATVGPDTVGTGSQVTPQTLDPDPPPPPPPDARTAEEFDTTTDEDRVAALATPTISVDARLGTTIVSLGPPTDPGIWIETPLVTSLVMGRVDYPEAGTTVALELRPSGGAAGSGSQISLAAMRLLEIPLTALAEVVVYGPGG